MTGAYRFFAVATVVLLLLSCSSKEHIEAVQAAVSHFRELMAAKKFDQIYAEASDNLKQAATADDLTKLLAAIDRKLGAVKSSQEKSWSIRYGTGGTVVAYGVQTEYERGSAFETFNFLIKDGKAILAGYNIRSKELILN